MGEAAKGLPAPFGATLGLVTLAPRLVPAFHWQHQDLDSIADSGFNWYVDLSLLLLWS